MNKKFVTLFLTLGFFTLAIPASAADANVSSVADLQAALIDTSTTTIEIAAGTYELSEQLNISRPVSITGQGTVILKSVNPSWSTTNGYKHLLGIYAGTELSPVTITNVTFDADGKSHAVNTYNNAYGVLNNVTIKNGKGAGITVNGSTIVASGLQTTGNTWGAVNVDPGSGVLTPSVFTLNSGTLAEANQIWSDGANVTETASVTVNATGYNVYKVAGTTAGYKWANSLASGATITKDGVSTFYTDLSSAIAASLETDTIVLQANATTTSQVQISKAITIDGNGYTLYPNFTKTDNANNAAIGVGSSNVTIKNLTIDGTSGVNLHGINIYLSENVSLDTVTVSNNRAGVIVNGSTVTVRNIKTSNNSWGGINVDQGTGVTATTTLTVTGVSTHLESQAGIWKDDNAKTGVSVVDTNNQYNASTYIHDTTVEGTKYVSKVTTVSSLVELQRALDNVLVESISIAPGTYELSSQLNISRPVSITGQGTVILKSVNPSWSTTNGYKHLLGIYAGTELSPVTITNVTFDADGKSHAVNTYNNAYGVLNNVTIKNGKGAGITVNGSTIVASGLQTTGNTWGAVNVDPGSGVLTPSVFTLNSGTLAEANQIWSDGANVTETASVTVNATGYNVYKVAGTTAGYKWANSLANVAIITKNSVSTMYSTIIAALAVAVDGDTIKIAPGNYNLVKDDINLVSGQTGWYLAITQSNLSLVGVTSGGQEITSVSNVAAHLYSTQETANGSWATQNLITVFGNDVTIQGLGIMNKISPNKGIEVLGNNFIAKYNKFAPVPKSLFANADSYDGGDDITKYGSGVYFNNNGATTTRTGAVTANTFNNSGITFDSFGSNWTVTITDNTFDGNKIWKSGGTDYYYSAVGATTWANQPDFTGSVLTIKNNKFINMTSSQPLLKVKAGMTGTFDARENWWGTASSTEITGYLVNSASSTINYTPWYVNPGRTTLNTEVVGTTVTITAPTVDFEETTDGGVTLPEGVSTLTLSNTSVLSFASSTNDKVGTNIIVGGATTSLTTFAVTGSTTTVDLSVAQVVGGQSVVIEKAVTLSSSGSSTQPITLTNSAVSNVSVSIPNTTTILAASGWDGTIAPPKTVTSTGSAPSGFSVGTTAISVGSADSVLIFDKPVTLTLSGTTGEVGYKSAGSNQWVKIDTTCTGTYANPTGAVFPGECKITDGTNTKILTYHFTTFGSLSVVAASVSGGGGYFINTTAPTVTGEVLGVSTTTNPVTGEVLGATAVTFSQDLTVGTKGLDVVELQKILIAEGYLSSEATGYFGALTKSALMKWQAKNKLPATGYFGPMTRSLLAKIINAPSTTAPANAQASFSRDLRAGSQGEDVVELQKLLIAEGYLQLTTPTNYFGALTKAALMKWQAKNGIPATGFFGTLSRGFVAK